MCSTIMHCNPQDHDLMTQKNNNHGTGKANSVYNIFSFMALFHPPKPPLICDASCKYLSLSCICAILIG